MTHKRKESYLFSSAFKAINKRRKTRKAKKEALRKQRQTQFRKGFVHKSSEPKQFDVKPELPTRGKKKRRLFF